MKQIKQISSPIFSGKFKFQNLVLVAKQHGVLDWCRVWPSKMPSVAIGPIIPFPTSCFLLTSVVCCFPMVVYHMFTHVFWFQLNHMMITYDRCCGMLLLDWYVQQQGRVVSQSIYSIETTPGTLFINHGFATTIMYFFTAGYIRRYFARFFSPSDRSKSSLGGVLSHFHVYPLKEKTSNQI